MAAVGLPCWTPHVWADPLWALGVWRDATTPPPPPPAVVVEDLQGGWLGPRPRWRGGPARRPEEDADDQAPGVQVLDGIRPPRRALSPDDLDAPDPAPDAAAARGAPAPALPPLDWTPALTLAQADATRRQARAARQEEEELLVVLLLLLEEL
jgi:hypothetical protein